MSLKLEKYKLKPIQQYRKDKAEGKVRRNRKDKGVKRPSVVSKQQFFDELARLYELRRERLNQNKAERLAGVENQEFEIDCRKLKAYRNVDEVTVSEWFSAVVALYMQKKGFSQEVLAGVLGIHRTTFGRYLNGRLSWGLDDVERVCRLIGLRFPEILVRGKRKENNG